MSIINSRTVANRSPRFKSAAPVAGDDGVTVLAVVYDNGDNGTFIEVWKDNADGIFHLITTRQAVLPYKWDAAGAIRVFNNLHVYPVGHRVGDSTRTDLSHEVFFNIF